MSELYVTEGVTDVEVAGDNVVEVSVTDVEVVEALGIGPQGIQGIQGEQGIPGGSYVHNQMSPSATWVITHSLGIFPNVTIVDSAGSEVEGDVHYDDVDTITVSFSSPFGGVAYLS